MLEDLYVMYRVIVVIHVLVDHKTNLNQIPNAALSENIYPQSQENMKTENL